MIYIVDEDVVQLQPLVAVLEYMGRSVAQIDNADDAYDHLRGANDVELVLLDVMLGTRDAETSHFSRVDTQDFLTTGLQLADKLCGCGNSAYPKALAFLSMASRPHLVDQIRERARILGIPYIDKRGMGRGIMEFAGAIEKLIVRAREE